MTPQPSQTHKFTTWIGDNWPWLLGVGLILVGFILAGSGLLESNLTLAWIFGGLGVLVLILVFLAKLFGPGRQSRQASRGVDSTSALLLIVLATFLLAGAAFALQSIEVLSASTEARIGTLIVLGVSLLMVLLFVMAAGFAFLGLADRNGALGLPEGSVRALIALLLILIFVMISLYLFNSVAYRKMENADQATDLAQQLLTTTGTLVVAVAGFYFGTRAVTAARGEKTPTAPTVEAIYPHTCHKSDPKPVAISGSDFVDGCRVFLRKSGRASIEASSVRLNGPSEITCTFDIANVDEDLWDVVVVNPDNTEGKKSAIFKIEA